MTSPINPDAERPLSERVQIDCTKDKVRVKQSMRDECDINFMMARFQSGNLPPVPQGHESYGDFSDVGSFQQALDSVMLAKESFSKLEANVRDRFNGNPAELIEFMHDEDNLEEAIELGLLAREEEEPPGTPPADPPAPPEPGPNPG